jgi:hypothetical protein
MVKIPLVDIHPARNYRLGRSGPYPARHTPASVARGFEAAPEQSHPGIDLARSMPGQWLSNSIVTLRLPKTTWQDSRDLSSQVPIWASWSRSSLRILESPEPPSTTTTWQTLQRARPPQFSDMAAPLNRTASHNRLPLAIRTVIPAGITVTNVFAARLTSLRRKLAMDFVHK